MEILFQSNLTDPGGRRQPDLGVTSSTLTLQGLADLIAALEPQLAALPVPAVLFAFELEKCLVEAAGLTK